MLAALFFSPFLLLRTDGLLLLFFWWTSCLSMPIFMVLTIICKTDLSCKILDLKSKYPSAAVIVGDFIEDPDLFMDRFPPKQDVILMIFVVSFLYWMLTGL